MQINLHSSPSRPPDAGRTVTESAERTAQRGAPALNPAEARLVARSGAPVPATEPARSTANHNPATELAEALPANPHGTESSVGFISTVLQWLSAVSVVRDVLVDGGSRLGDALGTLWRGVRSAAEGAARNLAEVGDSFRQAGRELRAGHVGAALTSAGRGLVQLVQTPIDAALMLGGKLLSAAQTLSHLEPVGRPLDSHQLHAMRAVFGDGIDLAAVRLKYGPAGVFSASDRPFTHGNTIYMQERTDLGTLTHELTHVWQHQHGGTDYMSESLFEQGSHGQHAYDWQAAAASSEWPQLGAEQQAALIESAYLAGAFATTPPAFPEGTEPPPGLTLAQLNQYLERAVSALRRGHGAP